MASIDKQNRIYVGAAAKDPAGIELQYEFLHNTKIAGSAIQEQKKHAKRKDKKHPNARAISLMEVISILLGYDQIHTNIKFVHVPTVPFEDRVGIQRPSPLQTLQRLNIVPRNRIRTLDDIDITQAIPACAVRQHLYQETNGRFHQWRTISSFEEMTLKDQVFSPVMIDSLTVFGVRPPELRFVSNPALYFRWFWRNTSSRMGPIAV